MTNRERCRTLDILTLVDDVAGKIWFLCKVVIIIIIPVATHFLPIPIIIVHSSPASTFRLRIVHSFMRSDVFLILVLSQQRGTAAVMCYAMILLLFVSLSWSGVLVLFVLTGLKEEDQHRPVLCISLLGTGGTNRTILRWGRML